MPEDRGKPISQFMWGYQSPFRVSAKHSLQMTLGDIGFTGNVDVLLIGFEAAGTHDFPICIEPEDGPYDPSLLANVTHRGEELYEQHPDRDLIHTASWAEEWFHDSLHRELRGKAIEEALASSEPGADRSFFASMPTRVDDYVIYVVISVDRESLAQVPRLQTTRREPFRVEPSLVHAVFRDVLTRASRGLSLPDPGKDLEVLAAGPPEIAQSAMATFVLCVFGCAGDWFAHGYGAIVSAISALPYEGRAGSGRLVIAKADHPAVNVLMKFSTSVVIENTRAVRKLLEASGSEGDLLSTGEKVFGLGRLTAAYDVTAETAFIVSVIERGTWELSHADQVLMTVRDGTPHLPRLPLNTAYFTDVLDRLLSGADHATLQLLAEAAGQHQHGAMLVISADAAGEAQRLAPQTWAVDPVLLAPELLRQLTSMDGGVLVDTQGQCHAIGVILDGQACGGENRARGSRFNNAVRYLQSDAPPAVVVVYSADGGIDILPRIRPRVRRSTVQGAVEKYLSLATPGDYPSGRYDAWEQVKGLKFYLSDDQCRLLNEARAALDRWAEEHSYFREIAPDLAPNPAMNETYWLPDDK